MAGSNTHRIVPAPFVRARPGGNTMKKILIPSEKGIHHE
jgi:hypothetical protein